MLRNDKILIVHIYRDESDPDIIIRSIDNQILADKNRQHLKNLQLCQHQIDNSGVRGLPN